MNTATLIPTIIESWQPSKRCYIWVKAYKVITPSGIELSPPIRATASRYERGAREFCMEQGWEIKIKQNND